MSDLVRADVPEDTFMIELPRIVTRCFLRAAICGDLAASSCGAGAATGATPPANAIIVWIYPPESRGKVHTIPPAARQPGPRQGTSERESWIATSMIRRRGWGAFSHLKPATFPRVVILGGGWPARAVVLVVPGIQVAAGVRRLSRTSRLDVPLVRSWPARCSVDPVAAERDRTAGARFLPGPARRWGRSGMAASIARRRARLTFSSSGPVPFPQATIHDACQRVTPVIFEVQVIVSGHCPPPPMT
jgi:hypothetical protein